MSIATVEEELTITKIIEWDMGHRVPNHKSKCRNLHGHRYRLEVSLSGPLIKNEGSSDEGMVFDFGDIKQIMMTEIHDVLDHGFMCYELDPFLNCIDGFETKLILVTFIPTAENIVKWCFEQLRYRFETGIEVVHLKLYETPNSWAEYSYRTKPVNVL